MDNSQLDNSTVSSVELYYAWVLQKCFPTIRVAAMSLGLASCLLSLCLLVVVRTPRMRLFTMLHLIAESTVDLFYCAVNIAVEAQFLSGNFFMAGVQLCRLDYFCANSLQMIRNWTILITAAERFCVIRFPTSARIRTLKLREASLSLSAIFVSGLTVNAYLLMPFNWYCLFTNQPWSATFRSVDLALGILVIPVPLLAMFLFTLATVVSLYRMQRHNKQTTISFSTLRVVLAISSFYFLISLPLLVGYCLGFVEMPNTDPVMVIVKTNFLIYDFAGIGKGILYCYLAFKYRRDRQIINRESTTNVTNT